MIEASSKTGRRPGTGSTKEAILASARDLFMLHGYKGATVRAIAGQAGVDPNLIRHFFGGKEGLFVAAMDLPPEALATMLAVFEHPVGEWGERLTRAYLGVWENPATAAPLRAILVSAFTNNQALERLQSFFATAALGPASQKLNVTNPELRIAASMGHLVGIALTRYILQAPAMREVSIDELAALIGPTIQRYLTGPLPGEVA